jgi:hypothetical protein
MQGQPEIKHDGQAPARRPPEEVPDVRGRGELDAPGEGEVIVPPVKPGRGRPVVEKQLTLPGTENV